MNALLLSCRLLQGELKERVDVYLGSIIGEDDIPRALSLAFGNCYPRHISFDRRIRGCPPYPFELGKHMKDMILS